MFPVRLIQYLILFFTSLFFISCDIKKEIKQSGYFFDFETDSVDACWIALNTRIKTESYSGQWCTTVNKDSQYGGGYAGNYPDSLQGRNIAMNFSCWVKAPDLQSNVNIAIALSVGDSVIFWNSVEIKKVLKEVNKWEKLEQTINFPASHTLKNVAFKLFLWSADGKSEGYMDDLSISFNEMETPSFIPQVESWKFENDKIFNEAKLYVEFGNLKDSLVDFELIDLPIKKVADSLITSDFVSKAVSGKISWIKDGTSYTNVESKIKFNNTKEVKRIALVILLNKNPNEFFLPGGLLNGSIQNEVWLGKEGLKASDGKNSILLYHQSAISSIQYEAEKKQLWINLDFSGDHPQVRAPLLNNGKKGVFENWSSSIYKKDDVLNSTFKYYLGEDVGSTPRFMNSPKGYEATYIWTEHADYGDIRTHKAVCFGDENISEANKSVGGFCKYKIPVTKSVFYSNDDQQNNSVNDIRFVTPVANIKQTTGFLTLLKELKNDGFEICLHTPDQYTAEKKLVIEAIDFFKENFNSSTWIDHGYDNGASDNREDFVCDGLDQSSKYFMRDVWEKSEVKYFWNSYHEDVTPYNGLGFENHLMSPFYGFGGAFPNPILFQHPTRSGNLYSWVSNSLLDYDNANWWSYYFNTKTITEFIKSRGTLINHCYPARVNDRNGFWIFENGVIKSHPEFDKALALLASYRDKGQLNITTIPEYSQYIIDVSKVELKVVGNGIFEIKNNSGHIIEGFSMVVKANNVEVLNRAIKTKRVNDEIIFWFDLNKSVIIKIIDAK